MNLTRFVLPCLLVLVASASARAHDGGLAAAYLYGYGGFGNYGMQTYVPSPPYFALHPPVYYGQRYTRPYGVSPFAAWPQLQSNPGYAPQRPVQRAQVISNPYCAADVVTLPVSEVVSSSPIEPLIIDNPYYESEAPAVKYTAK